MSQRNQQGIMLIELMIGLVIGLLTTLAIVTVLSVSEGQRRATMSGEDAQVSGALALHALQRDIRRAGYGLAANPAALGCPIQGQSVNVNGSDFAPPAVLAPVTIVDGANGMPDTVTTFASGKRGVSVPILVERAHLNDYFTVKSAFPIVANDPEITNPPARSNDWLLAVRSNWESAAKNCIFFKAVSISTEADGALGQIDKINHASLNAYPDVAALPFDRPPADHTYLVNMGNSVASRTYSVGANNVLQVTDFPAGANDVFPEIVNLQAFYGKDTNGDGVIDAYNTVTPTTNAGWRQILGVRVALVARSTQYEKEEVTAAGNVEWDVGTAIAIANTVNCASGSGGQCLQIKVDHLPDWRHYRYKVYDTMIPLRNILWNS